MRMLWRRLLYYLRSPSHDAELRAEIEAHRALRQDVLERSGVATADAGRESRRALGNATLAVEDARDVWVSRTADRLQQDVRFAARGLRKSPGFALVAIATLALGIGANTALFSILNSLMLRPLPVREPERLVLLAGGSWTYPIWEEIRRFDGDIFDGVFAWAEEQFDLSSGGQTDPVEGAFASGRFFEVLGVSAVRGRMFGTEEDEPGSEAVAVISHRLWQQRFAGSDEVIGSQLTVDRTAFTIIGVMPPGFFGPDVGRTIDLIVPFAAEPLIRGGESGLKERSYWWLEVMGRLEAGQTIERTTAALRAVQPHVRQATLPGWPAGMLERYLNEPFTLVHAAHGRSELRERFRTPLSALVAAAGLVLLVACGNIASLLLARTLTRRREFSVRLALGASRWRLARLLFTESLMVTLAGAAIGLLFAKWGGTLLVRQLNTWRGDIFLDLTPDWRVLAFTATLASVAALVSAVAPVLGLKAVSPGEALKDAGRGVVADRRFAIRGTLVAAQIAASLVLIVATALFLRTFVLLNRVPLGFAPEPLLVVTVRPSVAPDDRGRAIEQLREAAANVSGVTSAAVSLLTPVSAQGWNNWVGDSPTPPQDRSRMTWINATSPGWFGTMGIPLLAGRDFRASDRVGSPSVAIVNESFARRFLPGRSPTGRTIAIGPDWRFEIVGVVGDSVYRHPREGMMPTLYLPVAQREQLWPSVALTVATAPGMRASVQRELAAALTRVDPSIALTFRTFDQLVEATVTQERLVALLAGFFGGLALLLAGIGLYGIVAQAVRARRAEIGIRMALGAEPASIVRLVFQRVSTLVAAGIAFGLMCSFWAVRFIQTMLFQLDARDPGTFAAAAAALAIVGLTAAWLPARRAARLDPASVLRES